MVLDVIKEASLGFYMRAFTLIEMMVTVSLIAIITTFTVVNLNFERPERIVEQATREIYGTLLYARNLAISGKVFKDQSDPPDGVKDVPNGYGVLVSLLTLVAPPAPPTPLIY